MNAIQVLGIASILLLTACGSEDKNTIVIYESRGAIQCENEGISPETSAQKLINVGIDVIESNCAYDNLVDVITVCGAGTNDIIIHRIPEQSLVDAQELGFYEAEDYSITDCYSEN